MNVILLGGALGLALLLLECGLLFRLARQNAQLLGWIGARPTLPAALPSTAISPPPLPVGVVAPAFALPDLDGKSTTLETLRAFGKPVVLIFSDPGCGPCAALLPEIARWQREHGSRLTFVVISRGSAEANRPKLAQVDLPHLLVEEGWEVFEAYRIVGTPTAVVVQANGTIGGLPAQSDLSIRQLVTGLLPPSPPAPSLSPAPLPATSDFERRSGDASAVSEAPSTDVKRKSSRPDKLPEGARPVKQKCVEDELLPDGSIILYNGCAKQLLTLNPTASLVWECCDGDHDADAITAELREVFPTAAVADVNLLLDQLFEQYMILPG